MNVLLLGEESAGTRTLKALAQTRHRVVAVLASPRPSPGGFATLWSIAAKMGYETWPAALVKDPALAERIRAFEVDVLLNVHSLHIVHAEVLRALRRGAFNLHPGLLPRYAGLNMVSWAIYRGDQTHGVTLHEMVPEIDAGRIVSQASFGVAETDTALTLYQKCLQAGMVLISRLLETLENDPSALALQPQDLTQRQYYGKEVPNGGRVFWSQPARRIANFVRACDYHPFPSPWGHPRAQRGKQEIGILKATLTRQAADAPPGMVGPLAGKGVPVACSDEWLAVSRVVLAGEARDAAEVLRPGERLEDGR